MTVPNLRHPRICIFHIPERTPDAKAISTHYAALGAQVELQAVTPENGIGEHQHRLSYFDRTPRMRKIAQIIAKNLKSTERLDVVLEETPDAHLEFAIYLVTQKVSTETVPQTRPAPASYQPAPINSAGPELMKCPDCASFVRKDRIEKHLDKLHRHAVNGAPSWTKGSNRKTPSLKGKIKVNRSKAYRDSSIRGGTFPNTPKNVKRRKSKGRLRTKAAIFYYGDSTKTTVPTGPLFGSPGVLGSTQTNIKVLKSKGGLKRCRMCSKPAMYNSGECYEHNPK